MPLPMLFLIFWGIIAITMGSLFFFRSDIPARRMGTHPAVPKAFGILFMILGVAVPLGLLTGLIPTSEF